MHKVFGTDDRNQARAIAITPVVLRSVGVKPAIIGFTTVGSAIMGSKTGFLYSLSPGPGPLSISGNSSDKSGLIISDSV
jgi:hypothetical protein